MRNLIFLLLGLCCWTTNALAEPQLKAESLTYDFGEIIQGEQVEYIFQFRNSGDQVLVLSNLRSSCGCTVAELSSSRIEPGDSGELRTVFDSTRFRGPVKKQLSVDTNDPQQPQVDFTLSGDIRAEVVLNPERVSWGKVSGDKELTAEVIIRNQAKITIKLQQPQATNAAISAELSGLTLAPQEQVTLKIKTKIPAGKKRLGGYVIIATDYPTMPQLRVPLSARLKK